MNKSRQPGPGSKELADDGTADDTKPVTIDGNLDWRGIGMFKKLGTVCLLALAVVALADHVLVIGSNGSGHAEAANGRRASFHYSVTKRTATGHHPQLSDSLSFEQNKGGHDAWLQIRMGTPTVVSGGDGGVLEFIGPGGLTVVHDGHYVTEHGDVRVNVADLRGPHNPHGNPDAFRIRFQGKHRTYFFEGTVHHGDLVVFSRQEH